MDRTPETTHKTVTVLVVEDSATQREELRFVLEESGYTVVVASDGRDGLAAARTNAIDLVISDIVMPEMDGYALCKALRTDEKLQHLPVILLTSLTDPRDVIRGLESGANNFICKPYDARALLARVQNVLANQEIRKVATSEMGISILFAGQRFFITADRLQILDLLLSTYENAMNRNSELISTRDELRILNEQLEARVAERTAALAAEVAEHKRLQEREHHLNRMLTAIRNVNQLIVREKDPGRLIQQACEMLVETRGYRAVWIAVDGRGGPPSLVAQAGWGEAFEALSLRLREGKLPPCWEKARAAESGLAVFAPRETCRECPLWEAYGQDQAGVAFLRHGARDFGTLAICLAPGVRVEDEEAALLVEVASDLGLALHAMDTERRRAAYAQIVASSQDAMALVDRRYVFEEANPSYARLTGRDESAIVGHRVAEILGEEFFLRTGKPNLDRCFQGETVSFETSLGVSGLGSRFIEAQYSPCRASDGSISAAAVNIRDITERKRAEEELRFKNVVLATQQETAIDGILVVDANAKIVFSNRHFAEMWGVPADIMASGSDERALQSVTDKLVDPAGVISKVRHVYANREDNSQDEIALKDGRTFDRYSAPMLGADGKYFGRVWYFRDVTERKQAEAALRDSEARFRDTFERSTVGQSLTGRDGRLLNVNQALADMLGFSIEELQQVTFGDLTHPDDVAETQKCARSLFAGERTAYQFEKRYIHRDGHIVFADVSSTLLRDDQGAPLCLITSVVDITERKRAEAALASANRELERRVAERTAELTVANRELESFASSVSHDLRAPLRGIDGWSQAVLEDCGPQLDEQGHTYLKKVRSETQRMGELIDGLLELSRVTRASMKRETVDLTAMAQELEATLRAGEAERAVDFVVAPGLVVQGDAVLLRAVLQNLLHNAWKFTGKRPRARIEVGCTSEQGQTVYHVRDDGVGFEMRYAGKLFAPFERLHSLEEFSGTGVGLATVQRIIHRHGGKVWATAEVDQGATFYFTLTT
jgi:PAS domain S-box-containing protein